MVTYKLIETGDRYITYHYYPNDAKECGHGTIVIDRLEGRLELTELAPLDRFVTYTLKQELDRREMCNQMRLAEQMPELTEEEWPTPTGERVCTVFADWAIRDIVAAYNSDRLPEEGSTTCY